MGDYYVRHQELGRKGIETHTLIDLLEHLDAVLNITLIDRVLEARDEVSSMLGNLGHAGELLLITGGEVEEGELLEVPLLLVGHLHGLVVTMGQGLGSQAVPVVGAIQLASHLDSDLEVTAL